jgi:uncharacterized protein
MELLLQNLTNPALLFFLLGMLAVGIKSDLSIPENSSKFISIYLLFSIGFKGGQELKHEAMDGELLMSLSIGLLIAFLIPLYTFFLLKWKLNVYNAGAIAAAYGSVSAVTFITAVDYLELQQTYMHGYMVAVMAIMEAPAIVTGLLLITLYEKNPLVPLKKSESLKHALTNGSVLLILGSLLIGWIASTEQAMEIKPFTTDIFKGFLAIFLLDMGIISGRHLKDFFKEGYFPLLFSIAIPLINGSLIAWSSHYFIEEVSNRFMLAILGASASYIAVPAAMRISVPQANPGLFLPMALAITFPVNITLGLPLYYSLALG